MAYRWHPKNADVDPDNPRAWGTCDRCGFQYNLHKLQWQMDYMGSTQLQSTGFLVCDRCLDVPNPQDMPYILSPDPVPIFNARPEPYTIDEGSWLTTEDGSILTTQDGEAIGTAIPNPDNNAATAHLEATIAAPGAATTTLYLDIFNGNPLTVGRSVLSDITGSATRTNIASQMQPYQRAGHRINPETIIVTTASLATINTNYIGLYSAATAGTLLMSGTLAVRGPFVTVDNPVVFDALALTINT